MAAHIILPLIAGAWAFPLIGFMLYDTMYPRPTYIRERMQDVDDLASKMEISGTRYDNDNDNYRHCSCKKLKC